jgi:hypothetical protein
MSEGPRGLFTDRHKLIADFVAFGNQVNIHFPMLEIISILYILAAV